MADSETTHSLNGTEMQHSITQRIAGMPKVPASDTITYGKTVKVDDSNINKIGLSNDIVTHHMDNDGMLSVDVKGHNFRYDFSETSPMDFLHKFGFDDGSSHEKANPSFNLERVEVNGTTQAYFISNDFEDYGTVGLYLSLDAIDLSKMDPTIKTELLKPQEQSPILPPSTPSEPNAGNNFTN